MPLLGPIINRKVYDILRADDMPPPGKRGLMMLINKMLKDKILIDEVLKDNVWKDGIVPVFLCFR